MPIRYVCKHCGLVLWEFKEVGQDYYGLPTPEEIIRVYGGICPRCKADLTIPSMNDISIRLRREISYSRVEEMMERLYTIDLLGIGTRNEGFMAAQEV